MRLGLTARLLAPLLVRGPLGRLRLRARFVLLLVSVVVAFGTTNLVILETYAGGALAREIELRALTGARRLSAEVARPLLQDDLRSLRSAIAAATSADSDVAYVIVLGPTGVVLASSFGPTIPAGLAAANRTAEGRERSILVSDRGADYRDVAVPILRGGLGDVRVGARLDRLRSSLRRFRASLAAMVVVFLAVGLLGTVAAAELISAPVEQLASAARSFDPSQPQGDFHLDAPVGGEIAELTWSFQAMAARLQQLHADREASQERMVLAERLATAGALAAGIAHEVNNPLAGIRNCLQAIGREPEDVEQTRAYAEMMIEATRSIEKTVRSLGDVARETSVVRARVDLRALFDRLELLLRHRAAERGVALRLELERPAPSLRTDESRLHQVLLNLLLNAIDASPAGTRVALRATSDAKKVTLSVSDQGDGIAPENRERVWDPFFTTKTHRGGTGLGLAMVRRLVTELDGTVGFESDGDRGTTFVVTLPRQPDGPGEERPRPGRSAEVR